MALIYNAGIKAYILAIQIASLFNSRARDWLRGRRNLLQSVEASLNPGEKRVWFHCASLGEFEQGRPVIEEFRMRNPEIKIVLTFFSPSGFEVRKNYDGADYIFYLPADKPSDVRRFLDAVDPVAALFVKYEFWYNYLKEMSLRGVSVILISGIFRPSQHFFKWYGGFFRKMLSLFSHIFVQDEASSDLLKNIGINNVTISGDTRFDRVAGIVNDAVEMPSVSRFAGDSKVLVGGSTWPEDEELIARYLRENPGKIKVIVAPHEVEERNIARIEKLFGSSAIRYTSLDARSELTADVLIIDTIGILSSLYRYAYIAVIGGGFGKGIHNTLEAAAWGVPVLFGPNHKKFREAVDLISVKGGFMFTGYEVFSRSVNNLLGDYVQYAVSAQAAQRYVADNQGATEIITRFLVSISA